MKKDSRFLIAFFSTALVLGISFGLFGVPASQAAVFVVDATVADGDTGSLRDAVEQANATAGKETIQLKPGRYVLDLGQLDIQQDVSIKGSGANNSIIDGGGSSRVFFISTAVNADIMVTIEGVTITGGAVLGQMDVGEAACGGGIYNKGSLIISSSNITENSSNGWEVDAGYGGGICNNGNLSIKNSSINKNVATGLYASGGGIYNMEGSISLTSSKILDNTADSYFSSQGGGICSNDSNSDLTLIYSQVTGNKTGQSGTHSAYGGGIYCRSILTLKHSQVTQNTVQLAIEAGGGGIDCSQNTLIQNSQIIENSIDSSGPASGGGIRCSGKTKIERSQFTGNSINSSLLGAGGGIDSSSADLTILHSQISGNTVNGMYESHGGGIRSYHSGSSAVFALTGSQVTWNTASVGEDDGTEEGGGIWIGNTVSYTPANSLVRQNSPDQVYLQP